MNAADAFAHLTKGCVDVVTAESLKAKLARGKPLIVKVGFDPTAPDLHLGPPNNLLQPSIPHPIDDKRLLFFYI